MVVCSIAKGTHGFYTRGCAIIPSLFHGKSLFAEAHLVRFNQFHTIGMLLALVDDALVPRYLGVGAAATNGLSCFQTNLFRWLGLQRREIMAR
jgi:hypothetical protein